MGILSYVVMRVIIRETCKPWQKACLKRLRMFLVDIQISRGLRE